MNVILAVVAFLVLVGLPASRMEQDRREYTIHGDSHMEAKSDNSFGGVTPTAPELTAPVKEPILQIGFGHDFDKHPLAVRRLSPPAQSGNRPKAR